MVSAAPLHPADGPREIVPTPSERASGAYAAVNLQRVLEGLHQDGLVVLKGVVDVGHVDALNEYMGRFTDEIIEDRHGGAKYFNHGAQSNILQTPPVTKQELLFDDVYFNPFVIQVANAYLGHTPIWNFLTGNTALRNTSSLRQPVHKDSRFTHPTCPFYFIANVPLSDFSPANGSTEFWLGSHAHTTAADQVVATAAQAGGKQREGQPMCNVRDDVREERRAVRPPVQACAKRGDVMIRDLRTWHAGMPNPSAEHRIMIALGYQAPWYQNHTLRLDLPLAQGNFFMAHAGRPVEVRANLLSDEETEARQHQDNFDFRPSV